MHTKKIKNLTNHCFDLTKIKLALYLKNYKIKKKLNKNQNKKLSKIITKKAGIK